MRIAFLIGLVACLHSATAQVSDTLKGFDPQWGKIQCYEATVEVLKIRGEKPKEKFKTILYLEENSTGKFYTRLKSSRFDQQTTDVTESYDGETYMLLDKSTASSVCKITKTIPSDLKSFVFGISPLEPLRFLAKSEFKVETTHPKLQDIAAWLVSPPLKSSAARATYIGKPALLLEVAGGHDAYSDKPIRYKVFVSDDGMRLLGWECSLPDGRLTADLRINGWKSIKVDGRASDVQYPSAFEISYYNVPDDSNANTVAFGYSASVALTKISLEPEIGNRVDPIEADYIYDLDQKVLITNPK